MNEDRSGVWLVCWAHDEWFLVFDHRLARQEQSVGPFVSERRAREKALSEGWTIHRYDEGAKGLKEGFMAAVFFEHSEYDKYLEKERLCKETLHPVEAELRGIDAGSEEAGDVQARLNNRVMDFQFARWEREEYETLSKNRLESPVAMGMFGICRMNHEDEDLEWLGICQRDVYVDSISKSEVLRYDPVSSNGLGCTLGSDFYEYGTGTEGASV